MKSFKKIPIQADKPLPCPVCGSQVGDIAYVYEEGDQRSDFFQCPDCTFLFAWPVLIPQLDNRRMDAVDNAELFNSRILKRIYVNSFIKKEIRALRRAGKKERLRLLDVGCGAGWTTRVYADHGFDVVGLEPSQIRADHARQHYGIEVVCDYIENVEFQGEFDVVVLRHIVEHFADPRAVLRKIRSFLKKDGLLLVVVPNIDCLGRYLFETRWAWVLPWHCNFFNPASARRFLEEEGFEVAKFYQTPSPLYYPGAIIRTFPNAFVKRILGQNRVLSMGLCTPLALVGKWLGMGDNINLIVRVK